MEHCVVEMGPGLALGNQQVYRCALVLREPLGGSHCCLSPHDGLGVLAQHARGTIFPSDDSTAGL